MSRLFADTWTGIKNTGTNHKKMGWSKARPVAPSQPLASRACAPAGTLTPLFDLQTREGRRRHEIAPARKNKKAGIEMKGDKQKPTKQAKAIQGENAVRIRRRGVAALDSTAPPAWIVWRTGQHISPNQAFADVHNYTDLCSVLRGLSWFSPGFLFLSSDIFFGSHAV